jgi:hypothetical protein
LTSDRKIRANRENARASTGPKTAHGRARAARNALRHALSLPVYSDLALSEEVETFAREIAGTNANAEIQELAHRVAEAQIDLRRVRYARHHLLSSTLCDPDYESPKAIRKKAKLAVAVNKLWAKLAYELRPRLAYNLRARLALSPHLAAVISPILTRLESSMQSPPDGPQKFATILSDMTLQLAAMDRYERRALSRRKFAIRALDEARAGTSSIRDNERPLTSPAHADE